MLSLFVYICTASGLHKLYVAIIDLHNYVLTYHECSKNIFTLPDNKPVLHYLLHLHLNTHKMDKYARAYGGGFLGFQETPFDSKTISNITYLNKYTIINILARYAYLSVNTI